MANIVGLMRKAATRAARINPSEPTDRLAPAGLMSSEGLTWPMSAAVRSTTSRARPLPVLPTIDEDEDWSESDHSANSSALAKRPCIEGYRCSTRSARSVRRGAKRRAGRTRVRRSQNSATMATIRTVPRSAVGKRSMKSSSVKTVSAPSRLAAITLNRWATKSMRALARSRRRGSLINVGLGAGQGAGFGDADPDGCSILCDTGRSWLGSPELDGEGGWVMRCLQVTRLFLSTNRVSHRFALTVALQRVSARVRLSAQASRNRLPFDRPRTGERPD